MRRDVSGLIAAALAALAGLRRFARSEQPSTPPSPEATRQSPHHKGQQTTSAAFSTVVPVSDRFDDNPSEGVKPIQLAKTHSVEANERHIRCRPGTASHDLFWCH
jgi:hypothetical protein